MLHRLFILDSTASLVLCVLTAVLWVRSYQAADAVMFRKDGEQWRALSERGQLRVDNEPQVRVNAEANEWLTWPNFLRHQALDRFEEGGRIDRAERAAVEAEWAALGATFKPKTRIVLGSVRHGWVVAGAAV